MKYGLKQLNAFHAVLETRSMTSAAKMLGVSQPAISSLIARLEQDTGLTLFIRDKGLLKPTHEAVALLGCVSQVVTGARNVSATIDALREGTGGQLLISAQLLVGISLLPKIIVQFQKDNPEVRVRLQTTGAAAVRHSLSDGLYDIGIASSPLDMPAMRLQSYRGPCMALLPKSHPLTKQRHVTPKMLSGVPFISTMPERLIYHQLGEAFSSAGAEWNVICETDYFAVAANMVSEGAAITVVDPFTARQFKEQVAVRPFIPRIDYEFALYRHPDREMSAVAKKFVDAFSNAVFKELKAYG